MGLADRLFGTRRAMLGWAVASLVANIAIIVTGAVVRLTASGLGCDTWPRCNNDSYVAHGERGLHSYVEFGNRLLTFVLLAIAIGTVVAAWRSGAGATMRRLAVLTLLGIPAQGVIGGITVLTHLNPYVVALHLLATIVLVVWCTRMVMIARDTQPAVIGSRQKLVVTLVFWLLMAAIWLGTTVTGAGPHAGDLRAHRNGLPIVWIARVHAWFVDVTAVLVLWLFWTTRRLGQARAFRWTAVLLATMVVQGVIGYAQYFLGVPIGLVILHMVGIGLVTAAASWLHHGTRAGA